MKIVGKFIGETSCGFVTNQVYQIVISTDTKNQFVWVKDSRSSACCPYTNIYTLAANWEIPTQTPIGNNRR